MRSGYHDHFDAMQATGPRRAELNRPTNALALFALNLRAVAFDLSLSLEQFSTAMVSVGRALAQASRNVEISPGQDVFAGVDCGDGEEPTIVLMTRQSDGSVRCLTHYPRRG